MKQVRTTGIMLAAAVGLMFAAQPVLAAGSGSTASQAKVKCVGANSCKGQSSCKTATSAGPGQNSCKGQGFILTSNAKECREKGGHPESMKM
ncbi:MAG TPA: hypothetical protein VKV28_15050 [Candidatus Binataceae bacterium]|nr:hypothetical protein [Candidatus Binataceae bacterium]